MSSSNDKADVVLMMTWITQNLNLVCELDKKSDEKQLSVSDFYQNWRTELGEVSQLFSIRNPALFICSLYGLLLVPKENFWDDIPNDDLTLIDQSTWGDLASTITAWNYSRRGIAEPQTLRNYIKHLRNALAHTNYAYKYTDANQTPNGLIITLADKDNNGNHFEAELSLRVILTLGVSLCAFVARMHI